MKKIIRTLSLFFLTVFVISSVFALAGCEFTRKLNGAEITFPQKISSAETFSFKMKVEYKKGDDTTVIDMQCYKASGENGKEEYAYVFETSKAAFKSYKSIYADGKLYEVVNATANTGSYYVKEGVSVDDDGNMLYHVKKNILLTSVAALITNAKTETYGGEEVYRYDITINGKEVSLYYNSEVLVKFYVKFVSEEEAEDAEEYTITLSEYKFNEELPEGAFKRPATYGIGYIESPISFESWTEIITSFSGKL